MPTYQYKCKNCAFEFEDIFKMDDRNIPVENPQRYGTCSDEKNDSCDIQIVPQLLSSVSMRDSFRRHTNDGWKDRLKEIKRQNPGSNLDT